METVLTKLKWLFMAIGILVVEQAPMLFMKKGQPLWQVIALTGVMLLVVLASLWIAQKLGFFAKDQEKAHDNAILWIGLGFVALTAVKLFGGILLYLQHGADANTVNQAALEKAGLHPILLFTLAAIVAPVVEELIFRGLLFGKLFGHKSIIGLLFSSFLFGLIHMPSDFGSWFIYGGMGFVLGFVYYKTDKLHYTMWIHFLNNGIAVVLMLIMQQMT